MQLDRKSLSFEQTEGLAPLPTQLRRDELSSELRAKLWAYVYSVLNPAYHNILARSGRWDRILVDVHVNRFHNRIDNYNPNGIIKRIGDIFESGRYQDVYGWLDFVMKHDQCPVDFNESIQVILEECKSAYRVVDGIFWPITSEEERTTINNAVSALAPSQFSGARKHLGNAASFLTQGKYAESVRESISAVESVARVLEPTGDFSKALARLEGKAKIHGALKKGFTALYGYTSDEKGVRHALLETPESTVDESDAIFFIGACASFVTYLVNKSRSAGLT